MNNHTMHKCMYVEQRSSVTAIAKLYVPLMHDFICIYEHFYFSPYSTTIIIVFEYIHFAIKCL